MSPWSGSAADTGPPTAALAGWPSATDLLVISPGNAGEWLALVVVPVPESDQSPGPSVFCARTCTSYAIPSVSPVMTVLVPSPAWLQDVKPPVLPVRYCTSYPEMGASRSPSALQALEGAVQLTSRLEVDPAVGVTVGAPGASGGSTSVTIMITVIVALSRAESVAVTSTTWRLFVS